MNKKKLLKLLAIKEERKTKLVAKAEASEDVSELRSINTDISAINEEIGELRSLIEEIEAQEEEDNAGDPAADEKDEKKKAEDRNVEGGEQRNVTETYMTAESAGGEKRYKAAVKVLEQRALDLKAGNPIEIAYYEEDDVEERAVTVASSNLVIQTKYSNTLSKTANEVSGLIDRVSAVPLNGGNAYEKGFETGFGEGDYTTETGAYNDTDPTFDYIDIGKAKITAYTEITDEAKVLPNVDYQALVVKNVRTAIRKKITKMIMTGAGGSNAITGIFNAPTKVIPTATDIEISEIDIDTLDTIVFGYRGDEDVEDTGVLILSKTDLAAFAATRMTDGKKAYKISLASGGNMGTISSEGSFQVPFILNSVCPALSASGTAADTYCMAYGKLSFYEMPIFSKLTVQESRDFKFSTGQICYRGAVWAGGNVVSYKGFVRIKKVAAV